MSPDRWIDRYIHVNIHTYIHAYLIPKYRVSEYESN